MLILNSTLRRVLVILGVVALLYLFLVSIGMVGASFKLVGKALAQEIFGFASQPLTGLFIGIFATSLVQSSSTTTSIVVGLVAGGMSVETAIPIIMGANIGTSVTNTLVSVGHIGRTNEFKRAFAASTVHDFFNLMAVLILFPLQYFTNFLGKISQLIAGIFTSGADIHFTSPVKIVVKPMVGWLVKLLSSPFDAKGMQAIAVLVVAGIILFFALKYMTVLLRGVVMQNASGFFERTVFRTPHLAFAMGVLLTAAVQSSSITTSVVVPLAGAGILTLGQIYPYTLGANIGTTITAILAALAAPENAFAALSVALAHLNFNVCGIIVITSIPPIRTVPMKLAEFMASQAVIRKWVPFAYIAVVFFLVPLILIYVTR
ncbi:MAG: hypothetical protein C0608_01870 [Deltaproteobacteria bacterium]|nr:MAG: hypothetical protein C0608_01870 [Deltaproteobacteria bacterium]